MNKIYQKTGPTRKNDGFTLIELLVVVLIIGILAAVAVPLYQRAVEKARLTDFIQKMASYKKAAEVYYIANGSYPTDPSGLDIEVFSECQKIGGHSMDFYCPDYRVDANISLAGRIYVAYCPGKEDPAGPCPPGSVKIIAKYPLEHAENQTCSCWGDAVLCKMLNDNLCPG